VSIRLCHCVHNAQECCSCSACTSPYKHAAVTLQCERVHCTDTTLRLSCCDAKQGLKHDFSADKVSTANTSGKSWQDAIFDDSDDDAAAAVRNNNNNSSSNCRSDSSSSSSNSSSSKGSGSSTSSSSSRNSMQEEPFSAAALGLDASDIAVDVSTATAATAAAASATTAASATADVLMDSRKIHGPLAEQQGPRRRSSTAVAAAAAAPAIAYEL
jgi:hypothetical protein